MLNSANANFKNVAFACLNSSTMLEPWTILRHYFQYIIRGEILHLIKRNKILYLKQKINIDNKIIYIDIR